MSQSNLNYIKVNVQDLTLGFNEHVSKYINWKTYEDTWKIVDRGETDMNALPLFHALRKYYSSRPKNRLNYERKLLGLKHGGVSEITIEWIKRHIELYYSIKNDGYKPELRKNPVEVRIKNDGSIKVVDGNHTVSILRHLRHRYRITVKVVEREDGWLNLKMGLYNFYGKKLLYQPVEHPDFDDWDVDRESVDRWNAIKDAIGDIKGKHVIDLGSCTGYFTRKLTDLKAYAIGVELNPHRIFVAQTISKFKGYGSGHPAFFCKPYEDFLLKNIKPKGNNKSVFDVGLHLSVLHHYIRRDLKEAWKSMMLVSEYCDRLILELEVENIPIVWSPELILENTKYTSYRQIYKSNRPIYLYTK